MAAKKESIFETAAKTILNNQNKDFKKWRDDILTKRKMKILNGTDKAWEKAVIEEECIKLMAKNIK
ncbi:DUF5415 family protein [Carnobacterium maltaromaticum]|uniref:DUF5415 family protein n=1 Tax=Carnobacterium maltaromaticum TaxID=2751 RepID=UPI00055186E3|nr:DUF5415 family protein [Carnobacterium maltaromaticum]KRN67872.1 hypothetical protein IV70_GL001825 [Carnobacterium maltaromaticum DSM 20342]